MNILAIETATPVCGIALFRQGELVDVREDMLHRTHAEKLPIYFEELRDVTNLKVTELDGIAVSIGPGSFTGLRIGLSYAKGLAFSADIPLVPVPTLQAMVLGTKPRKGTVRCLLHSHKDIAYGQDYKVESSLFTTVGNTEVKTVAEHLESLPAGIDILHFGCDELLSNTDTSVVKAIPSAYNVGKLACDSYDDLVECDFYELEPDYMSVFKLGEKLQK